MHRFLAVTFFGLASHSAFAQTGEKPAPVVTAEVTLKPGDPASKLSPRYSPKGEQLKLTPKEYATLKGFDHLETRVKSPHNCWTTVA